MDNSLKAFNENASDFFIIPGFPGVAIELAFLPFGSGCVTLKMAGGFGPAIVKSGQAI
jgi:hypothetical protein